MSKFWILWNPTAPMPPKVRFTTQAEAERVAEIMARRQPGDTFLILAGDEALYRRLKVVKTETMEGRPTQTPEPKTIYAAYKPFEVFVSKANFEALKTEWKVGDVARFNIPHNSRANGCTVKLTEKRTVAGKALFNGEYITPPKGYIGDGRWFGVGSDNLERVDTFNGDEVHKAEGKPVEGRLYRLADGHVVRAVRGGKAKWDDARNGGAVKVIIDSKWHCPAINESAHATWPSKAHRKSGDASGNWGLDGLYLVPQD